MSAQSGQEHRHLDLFRRGEQTVSLAADALRYVLRNLALQKLDDGADRAGAVRADRLPARRRRDRDVDLDLIDLRAANPRLDLSSRELQVDHGAVVDISAPAWQPAGEVGIALQIVAPGLAPKGLDTLA